MSTYQRARALLLKTFDEHGVSASLSASSGALNPITGKKSTNSSESDVVVMFKNINSAGKNLSSAIKGDQLAIGDKVILCMDELKKGQTLTCNGVKWSVFGVDKTIVDGQILNYTGFVREHG